MLEIAVISILAITLVMFVMRFMPRIRFYVQCLLQNPIDVKRIMAVGAVVVFYKVKMFLITMLI